MEKQHLKRLSYGFSALVMSLSAVAWMPSSAFATNVDGDVAVATVDGIVADDSILNLTDDVVLQGTVTLTDGETLTVNLNGHELSSTAATMFQVQAGATLTITGNGTVNQGAGVITDSTSKGTIIINGGTYSKSTNEASRTLFNCAETTITINGGDFSAIEQTFGGYGITRGGATVTINGGTFGYEPTVSEGKAVYEVADGEYQVAKLSVFTANNTNYVTTTGTKLNVGNAPVDVIVNGEKWFPEVVVTNTDDEEVGLAVVSYTYNTTSGNLKITPAVSGKYYVTVTDRTGEDQVIVVTAYDALPAAETYYRNLGDTVVLNGILDEAWETTYSLAEDDEANTTVTENGSNVTITADTVGTDVYTFSKTVEGIEDPITTTVTVTSYKVANEYILGTTPVRDDIEDIIELPAGWNFAVAPLDADDSKVNFASDYFLPVAKGSRTFAYTLNDGTDDLAPINLTVYVNGAATEVADQMVKLGAVLDLAPLYVNKANEASVVTYTGDVTAEGESTVDTSTVGTKTVTITETLAGEVIAEQDVEIEVYGIELPAVEFFAGESYDFEPAMEGTTILGVARSDAELSVSETADGYQFSTDTADAGPYTVMYTVKYENGDSEILNQNVTVYDKLAISDEDLTIDVKEGSEDTNASFTVAGDGVITVSDVEGLTKVQDGNTYTFTATEKGEYTVTVTQTISESLSATEDITIVVSDTTVVELESVAVTIENDKIETEYNEGYEGTPVVTYTVPEEFEGVVAVAADGTITVADDYKTATDKTVTITVTATDGEIVKTTTVDYTIEANYTAVEASFEDDKDTIKPSETTKLVMPEVEGVVYTWDYNGPIEIAEDGTISVNPDFMSGMDEEVVITINGFAGEGEDEVLLASKNLTLTVKANWSYDDENTYEVVEGDKQSYTIGSGKSLTFKIDAPYDQVMGVELYNKTLMDYLESLDTSEMTQDEIDALLTEEQWESLIFWGLEEGVDYTIEEGSTILTLTDTLMAKLVAGEYALNVYYRDANDIDNIVDRYAEATFTVGTGTPDTGAATAVKSSATASIIATVFGAIAMVGAAVVAKFVKRK